MFIGQNDLNYDLSIFKSLNYLEVCVFLVIAVVKSVQDKFLFVLYYNKLCPTPTNLFFYIYPNSCSHKNNKTLRHADTYCRAAFS